MSGNSLTIQRIDTRHDNVQEALSALREKLSPQGNMVSEAGRQRTIAVFGEPFEERYQVAGGPESRVQKQSWRGEITGFAGSFVDRF